MGITYSLWEDAFYYLEWFRNLLCSDAALPIRTVGLCCVSYGYSPWVMHSGYPHKHFIDYIEIKLFQKTCPLSYWAS